jgi:hypothetical protein
MSSAPANIVEFPAAAPAAAPGTTFTPNQLVEKLLAIRAKIEELRARQRKEMEPFTNAEAYLEGRLMDVLNSAGAKSMRADAGTFYLSKHSSVKVMEWSKTLDYIRENEAWELLEARVSKTAAQAVIEHTQQAIPGVEVKSTFLLNVRSAKGS